MNAGDAHRNATTRWWLSPALARLAFGDATQGARATRPTFPPSAVLEIDLSDPAQREFGDYELIDIAGRGGMGVVYRARQRGLDREVALKLLSAGDWAGEDFVENFRREAKNAALLQHPNIVVIHEMGEHGRLIYYAMQLVRGKSLSQRLDHDGPLPPRDAARLLRTIAEAVDYAHRLGVLHLDLKPGNILINEHGEPLVADFGLARRLEQALDNDSVAGTPSYMAPEQAQVNGSALSPATDVWGLGAVLYEMLTGHAPFEAETPGDALRLLQEGEIRKPSRYLPLPKDLEAICLKCLRRHPSARYVSARALADDLGRFLEGRAVSVRPLNVVQRVSRWARREKLLAAASAVAVLVLVVGIITTSLQKQRADNNAATASERLWESRREAALRLEQDGKGWEALPRLLQNIEEQEHAGKHDLAQLERRRIGMMLGQGATLIDTISITDANPLSLGLSDDGALLALAFNDQSVRWYDTATLHERGRVSLADVRNSEHEPRLPLQLRFVDDHRLLATLEWYSNIVNPNDSDSWLIDLDRKAVIAPPPEFTDFADASFSPDGRHAVLRNHRKQIQAWSTDPWRPVAALTPTSPEYDPFLLSHERVMWLGTAMRKLYVTSLHALQSPRLLDSTPGDAGISAWAMSDDGRTIALGDFEGRLFLLDTDTWTLRPLATSRSREITWVAFSEDDQWVAAVSWDGAAYAFDVRSGDSLIAGQVRQDFILQRVGITHARRQLIVAGEGRAALWQLPQQGPRAIRAARVGTGPAPHGLAGRYAVDWSFRSGLLATAGLDGQVRLWRMPLSPTVPARAARQIPEKLFFDGHHVVDVEWNRLRILALDGGTSTKWIELPQPPGFAELTADGKRVVVTVGPQLRVYDSTTLRLTTAPTPLPASPQLFLLRDAGDQVVLGFGHSDAAGFAETLQRYDVRSGQRLAGAITLRGPLRHLEFSADGSRLLVVGPQLDGTTSVLANEGLRVIREYPHDAFQPVVSAAFADNGDVWMVLRAPDPRLGDDALLRWDPRRDQILETRSTGQARPVEVIATRGGPLVGGVTQDLLDPGGAHPRILQRMGTDERAFASSASGRLAAITLVFQAQLYDTQTGAAMGQPLPADLNALDYLNRTAFSPDGRRLLALSAQGYWLQWPIAEYTRPVAEIARNVERLDPQREDQRHVLVPSPERRRTLRATDPGPWTPLQPRPQPAVARTLFDYPIPARMPGTSPLMLDLTPAYNIDPEVVLNSFYNVLPTMRPMPVGVQRINGVDYDLRGMVQYGAYVAGRVQPNREFMRQHDWRTGGGPLELSGVAVPDLPVAAIRLLMMASTRTPVPDERVVAQLRIRYRDGSTASVPIRVQRELPGYSPEDRPVPLAWALGAMGNTYLGTRDLVLSDPRLPNPHPERRIRSLTLSPVLSPESAPIVPLVFAISIEPAAPSVAKAVISPAVSRSTSREGPIPIRRTP